MNKIIPSKLNIGDEIRIIAPSRSMCILSNEVILKKVKRNLLVFGQHIQV